MTVPFRLALAKMSPRELIANPVLLVVEIGAVVTTVATVLDPSLFSVSITLWLWLTVLFGTLAEAVAEGRGKAQAASLRNLQQTTTRATPVRRMTKRGLWVGRVPAPAGTRCWAANRPARASTKTIGRNRPASMQTPRSVL